MQKSWEDCRGPGELGIEGRRVRLPLYSPSVATLQWLLCGQTGLRLVGKGDLTPGFGKVCTNSLYILFKSVGKSWWYGSAMPGLRK